MVPEQPLKPRLHSLGEETESSVEVAVCLHECLLRLCVCSWASSRMSVLSASKSACSAFACASVDIARHKTPPRFLLLSASAHAHWNTSSQGNARPRTHSHSHPYSRSLARSLAPSLFPPHLQPAGAGTPYQQAYRSYLRGTGSAAAERPLALVFRVQPATQKKISQVSAQRHLPNEDTRERQIQNVCLLLIPKRNLCIGSQTICRLQLLQQTSQRSS